jgi:signal transduction histidine kinase
VRGSQRRSTIRVAEEAALAFLASAAFFALAAAPVPVRHHLFLILLLGAVYIYIVVMVAQRRGPTYGVPFAIAAGLAFDSFYIPPTRDFGSADWQNWLVIAIYLALGVLIGMLGARSQRRAEASEQARGLLAQEQAALRRVATLIARGERPEAVFASVAEEVGVLLDVDGARVVRYLSDDEILQLEGWTAPGHDRLPVGPLKLEGTSMSTEVLRTAGAVRIEDYASVNRVVPWFVQQLGIRSGVAAPIVVDGRLWGAMLAWSLEPRLLPENAESRLVGFTELVAMAVSNTASREELAQLAREQAALRRVATLVASGVPPPEVFGAVAEEVGLLLGVSTTHMGRYDADGTVTGVGSWSADGTHLPVGTRANIDGSTVSGSVFSSGRPVRMDNYGDSSGPTSALVRELGIRSTVGAPIVVEGRLWGVMVASSKDPEPLPADTESRIAAFTELAATAISNTEARVELAASRARIVETADEERRRVVRDLHDGAQQRLVHTVVMLKLAGRALENDEEGAPALVTEALEHAKDATAELRELAHGILPSVLTRGGLRAGVDALASRMPMPVEIGVSVDRLPPAVEATAYFVVAEALTNVVKHSRAHHAAVTASVEDGTLQVQVRDDGVGGAQVDGSGFLGLGDRLAVIDGRLRVESPPEGGTLVAAAIPFARA